MIGQRIYTHFEIYLCITEIQKLVQIQCIHFDVYAYTTTKVLNMFTTYKIFQNFVQNFPCVLLWWWGVFCVCFECLFVYGKDTEHETYFMVYNTVSIVQDE